MHSDLGGKYDKRNVRLLCALCDLGERSNDAVAKPWL